MIHIGLEKRIRVQITNRLQKLLANEYILYTKTLNYHWNVTGPHFDALHALFNNHYEQLLKIADDVAERIRALGEHTHATLEEFKETSTIQEHPDTFLCADDMIADLADGHEEIIRQLRPDITFADKSNDMATSNFLSNILEQHEKIAWILQAHREE